MGLKTRIYRIQHRVLHLIATTRRFLPHYTLALNHVLNTIHIEWKRNGSGTQTIGSVRNCFINWCIVIPFFDVMEDLYYIPSCIAFGFAFARALCKQACDPLFIPPECTSQCRRILNYARLSAHVSCLRPLSTTKEMPKHVTMGINIQWCYVWWYNVILKQVDIS